MTKLIVMKKLILLAAIISFLQYSAKAQEQSVFTHYHINPVLINPATTGFNGSHEAYAHLKHSWTDFPGAPKTYALSYHGPVAKTFGLGLSVFSEDVASLNRFRAAINYAFRYKVDKLKFGFGFTTEYSQWSVPNSVRDNPFYDAGDELVDKGIGAVNSFDASLGLHGLYNEKTYIGIAFPNIIMARLDGNRASTQNFDDGGYYMFNVGHKIEIAEGVQLEPSLMLRKARQVPFMADINLRGLFLDERLMGGLTYRTGPGDILAIQIGTKQKNFIFYYTFDVAFQGFQNYNNGSHEITLGYRLPAKDRSAELEGTIEQLTN